MPLSKPAARRHVHTRDIVCRGFQRDDGLWDIEAALTDSKTYSFDNHDRGRIAAGEPIHGMAIRLTVDDDLVVRAAEAVTDFGPFNGCAEVAPKFDSLVGLTIGPGWRRAVLERMGRVRGCTHLTDLLLGPLAATAHQTIAAARAARHRSDDSRRPPALVNSCHAFAADGPVVARLWPDWARSDPEKTIGD